MFAPSQTCEQRNSENDFAPQRLARIIFTMLGAAPRLKKRVRGNPNWGKFRPIPALQTEFEKKVARLGLSRTEYAGSAELKLWCERNRNRIYVPEWLLEEWGMTVEATFTGAA